MRASSVIFFLMSIFNIVFVLHFLLQQVEVAIMLLGVLSLFLIKFLDK